jgi:hypothetical protein
LLESFILLGILLLLFKRITADDCTESECDENTVIFNKDDDLFILTSLLLSLEDEENNNFHKIRVESFEPVIIK